MRYTITADTDEPILGDGSQTLASQFAIQITGTWTGTLNFKGGVDGTNRVAMAATPLAGGSTVTTTTGNGVWRVDASALKQVSIKPDSGFSGTAVITAQPVIG